MCATLLKLIIGLRTKLSIAQLYNTIQQAVFGSSDVEKPGEQSHHFCQFYPIHTCHYLSDIDQSPTVHPTPKQFIDKLKCVVVDILVLHGQEVAAEVGYTELLYIITQLAM